MINIHIVYPQICIFDFKIFDPFNDWSTKHIQQGFSWRNENVSFGPLQDGPAEVFFDQFENYKKEAVDGRSHWSGT